MGWILIIAYIGAIFWVVRRGRERAAERAASGQLRSPLHWAGNALVLLLLALTFLIMKINHQPAHIPNSLWMAVGANVVALLFVRRALKWRYG
jgi:hypothetical protein